MVREIIDFHKIDAIWFMTDPRFYGWFFNIMDEIQDRGIPILYYHVWDCQPTPKYNKSSYDCCSFIGCISKITYNFVKELCGTKNCAYIPHGLDVDLYKPYDKKEIKELKNNTFVDERKDKFILFYNSRNARRKMTSMIVEAYAKFAEKVGKDKVFFLMHTDPHDPEGANLFSVCEMLGLKPEQIAFSKEKVPPEQMAVFYNIADVTINVSNNEGFGLSCLESLACGTPVIVNKTGGLQDQVFDDENNELGICLKPLTRTLSGSQEIPYIYDDRNSVEQVVEGLLKLYNMSEEEREEIGKKARNWVLKNFTKEKMVDLWEMYISKYIENFKKNGNPNRIKFGRV